MAFQKMLFSISSVAVLLLFFAMNISTAAFVENDNYLSAECADLLKLLKDIKNDKEQLQALKQMQLSCLEALANNRKTNKKLKNNAIEELALKKKEQQERKFEEARIFHLLNETADLGNGIQMHFATIPPGEFVMGCQEEPAYIRGMKIMSMNECPEESRPPHKVQITKAFQLGFFEVTQKQWHAVMGDYPSYYIGDDRPVENISWKRVHEFLKRMNEKNDGYRYRLPTEAEWEYAASHGESTPINRNKYIEKIKPIAVCGQNGSTGTYPVQRTGSLNGLSGMFGNVAEWVEDYYDKTYYSHSLEIDPTGPATGTTRVVRGGDWWTCAQKDTLHSRSYGDSGAPGNLGFRCVRVAATAVSR